MRRAAVRTLTRMTATPALRPLGAAGMRMLFDRLADDWEKIRADPVYRDAFKAGLEALPRQFPQLQRRPERVLDVACGTGIATAMLRERLHEADILGIDISPQMIEHARKLVPNVRFEVASTLDLPYGDATFDLVTSLDGIFVVAELARVTAHGGAIVLVYSRGAHIPVARPLEQLATEARAAGLQCITDASSAWWLWAMKP